MLFYTMRMLAGPLLGVQRLETRSHILRGGTRGGITV